jgi:cell division protein FtsX
MPFWLVTFGALASAILLACAGAAQTLMERRASVGYLDVQELMIPLYNLWMLALIVMFFGLILYGLAFYLRRPRDMTNPT